MKISKMAASSNIPEWLGFSGPKESVLSGVELDHIVSMPTEMNENSLVKERDYIEKCASSGTVYHYSSKWSPKTKSHLKEYCVVAGVDSDKMQEVDPELVASQFDDVTLADCLAGKDEEGIFRTASSQSDSNDIPKLEIDAFHLDEIQDRPEPSDWEKIDRQANLDDVPSMSAGVRPVRGGEDYTLNREVGVNRTENSIVSSDNLDKFMADDSEDNGARLRRENEEREQQKATNHKEWEQEKIASMESKDILPKGNVFPTEIMNAQPGLGNSTQMVAHSDYDPSSLPEKTLGETLGERNEARRKSIQREESKEEFHMSREASRCISDTFTDSLKKKLGK